MIGQRKAQTELFEVGNVYPLALRPTSFHYPMALAAPLLFQDSAFAVFYSKDQGRPSVPPSQLALLTLLQHESGCSDAEAIERSGYDLRWAAVLRREAGEPLCAKSTLQLFRAHLILHEEVKAIFNSSLAEARRTGQLKNGPLRIALDTKPIEGQGAVRDTYNLLGTGIQQLVRALARAGKDSPESWAQKHGLDRYLASSLKGSADLDWSDPEARHRFLSEIVADAKQLLATAGAALGQTSEKGPLRKAAELLEALLLQDIVEAPPALPLAPEGPQVTIRQETVKDRIPSATDPEQRHGRKSASKRFNGHKAAVAVDLDSSLILAVEVLPGNAADAQGALEQVEQVEKATGQRVKQTVGDCAYGGGETRQAFEDSGRDLLAKVPQEASNSGRFPKSAFKIDLELGTVTCPAGEVTSTSKGDPAGGRIFAFGARCASCPLRAACTASANGRTLRVHPQEESLSAARAYQQTSAGRAVLRERGAVEHRLARLGQLGIGRARYRGRKKTGFQLLIAATLANLRLVWNRDAAQPQTEGAESARGRVKTVRTPSLTPSPTPLPGMILALSGFRALWCCSLAQGVRPLGWSAARS